MTKKKINLSKVIGSKLPDKSELDKMMRNMYEEGKRTKENMSYWFPKLTKHFPESILTLPRTKIIQLPYEIWDMLGKDKITVKDKKDFGKFLEKELGNFEEGRKVFLKTGIFSNKFDFKWVVGNEDRSNLVENFLNIHYAAMMYGATGTSEIVVREYIESLEEVPKIYEGMPLHTEFRVFYDFDKREVLGISNYWNPNIMIGNLKGKDYTEYEKGKEKIVKEYDQFKDYVAEEVNKFMKDVQGITGRWSVDVMKNGGFFWLIDMARMERSALVDVMDEI